jgi:multiple sugar transport system substrate-binding protein
MSTSRRSRGVAGFLTVGALALVFAAGSPPPARASAPQFTSPMGEEGGGHITIAWAQWKPSELLRRLAKRFTRETGIAVRVRQIPWSDFERRIQKDIWKRHSSEYDLIVGDSQWLGRGATEGRYVDLTDWSESHVPWEDVVPAARTYYCEYGGSIYAVPCEADAPGFAYRRDLFEDAGEKAAFQGRYGYPLAPPETWAQFRDVAEFFNRPEEGLRGAALFYGGVEQYDMVTMGFDQVLWSMGGALRDPETGAVEGVLNSPAAVEALRFFARDLRQFTPAGAHDLDYGSLLGLFTRGKVAMVQSWYTFFPTLTDVTTNPLANRTGFFVSPAGPGGHFVSLGGQGLSLSSYSKKKGKARRFMAWFSKPATQRAWAAMGGLTCYESILESPEFRYATPFNRAFADSVPLLRDFYNVPKYAALLHSTQAHWHAVVDGEETPKQALDAAAAEHEAILNP